MAEKFRRRNYFIKKNFQTRFILRFILVSYLWNVLAVILFDVLASRKVDSVLFSMTLPSVSMGRLLFREALIANSIAVLCVILVFTIATKGMYTGIVRSLFRIRADLMRFGRGDLGSRVMLSEDDEFRDFAEELNSMVAGLGHRFEGLKRHVLEIDGTAKKLKSAGNVADEKVLREKILRDISALEEEMRGFKR